ncbi:MAG: hypothetical protein JWR36_1097 [Glaciihabitans sp.]|jgi:hypothetical protein|nr:hypothetical protein [Glaciihabitans sp.]MDQ1570477.1 hypothetical protein [Actinomycetota bacterium]
MVEAAQRDVLSFVDLDVERKSAWGPGQHTSRQIAVNGTLLGTLLATMTNHAVDQSTPVVDGKSGAVTPAAYFRALLGGPKEDQLPEGRIAIGYCDACLDASCGVLLAATLAIEGTSVLWTRVGFEQEDAGPAPKLTAFWKKKAEPEPEAFREPWITTPFEPEITFRFDRDQYLEAVQAERRRLAAAISQ